jgi:hypothetical protein
VVNGLWFILYGLGFKQDDASVKCWGDDFVSAYFYHTQLSLTRSHLAGDGITGPEKDPGVCAK